MRAEPGREEERGSPPSAARGLPSHVDAIGPRFSTILTTRKTRLPGELPSRRLRLSSVLFPYQSGCCFPFTRVTTASRAQIRHQTAQIRRSLKFPAMVKPARAAIP